MKLVSSALCIALAAGFAVAAPAQPAPRSAAKAHKSAHKKSPWLPTTATYGPPPEAAVPPPPPTPAQMPPVPASVALQNGLLTIAAENSTLADVLTQVRAKTGASIDIPPSAGAQRVVIHAGPLPPRDALVALLTGSGFDYVIVGSDQDPESVQRVILTPHQGGPARAGNVAPMPTAPPQRQPTGDPDVDDSPNAEIQPATPPPTPSVIPRPMPPPATTGTQPNGDQQPQVKTPQQLLEELQRLQQQRQQNQQNPPPQVPPVPR